MGNQRRFLLHKSASARRSVLVQDFLAKNYVTKLEHPPCSPDMTPADLYLILRQKSTFKGRRFCYATDTIENATEELKRASQNGFQEGFEHFTVSDRSV